MTPRVLIVSKPLVPPWNDSGKNVARDVVRFGEKTRFTVLTTQEAAWPFPSLGSQEQVYRASGTFGSRVFENARVAGYLLRQRDAEIVHYFFAPNRMTSTVARIIGRLRARQTTVQTVLSAPRDLGELERGLFADQVVTVSRFRARQVPNAICIPPGVPIGPAPSPDDRRTARERFSFGDDAFVALYAGDLEFSNAARLVAAAVPRLASLAPHVRVVFACRSKTPRARAVETSLRGELTDFPAATFVGEVDRVRDLLLAADVTILPADDTFAKADLPLVLLESLEVGTPIVVGRAEPLTELLGHEGALSVDPRDAAELVATLSALANEPTRVAAMREAARADAVLRFDARQMASAHETLYAELAARRVQRRRRFW